MRLIMNVPSIAVTVLNVMSVVSALDTSTMYRVSSLQDDVVSHNRPWATMFSARFGHGDASQSLDSHGRKRSLFSVYGPLDITRLGLGVQGLASKPTTQTYWNTDRSTGVFDTFSSTNPLDGKVDINGRFRVQEIDFQLQQNLFWNLYVQLYLPYKDLRVDKVSFTNRGSAVLQGNRQSVSVASFVTDALPAIVKECGYNAWATSWHKKEFGDLVALVGWHDTTGRLSGNISKLAGYLQIGGLVPMVAKQDINDVFSLPVGYNQVWGVIGRGGIEVELWRAFKLGALAGTTIFLESARKVRVVSDKDKKQQGWLRLEKAHASVDTGSLWDLGMYLKHDAAVKGLSLLVGYSFMREEHTSLHIQDDNYLATVIAAAMNVPSTSTLQPPYPKLISQDDVANADMRLHGWEMHILHLMASYDAQYAFKSFVAPSLRVSYDYPLAGKYSWKTEVISGTLGLSMEWNF